MRKGKIPEDYTFCEEWSFYIPFLTDIWTLFFMV